MMKCGQKMVSVNFIYKPWKGLCCHYSETEVEVKRLHWVTSVTHHYYWGNHGLNYGSATLQAFPNACWIICCRSWMQQHASFTELRSTTTCFIALGTILTLGSWMCQIPTGQIRVLFSAQHGCRVPSRRPPVNRWHRLPPASLLIIQSWRSAIDCAADQFSHCQQLCFWCHCFSYPEQSAVYSYLCCNSQCSVQPFLHILHSSL